MVWNSRSANDSDAAHGIAHATCAPRARLPMLLTLILSLKEAVDFLDLGARAGKQVEHWRARLCGKQRKSKASERARGYAKLSSGKGETFQRFRPLFHSLLSMPHRLRVLGISRDDTSRTMSARRCSQVAGDEILYAQSLDAAQEPVILSEYGHQTSVSPFQQLSRCRV